jgi:hypothetical protein
VLKGSGSVTGTESSEALVYTAFGEEKRSGDHVRRDVSLILG